MRAWMPLALVLALTGCPEDEPFRPIETDDTDPPADADGDGFDETVDCDDNDPDVSPGKTEVCDEKDNDCDGNIDEGFDNDGDGHYAYPACPYGDDCDDRNGKINPSATEKAYDGIDQDCDGEDLVDVDADGFDADVVGGDDCDDEDADVNPGVEEIAYDGIDQDCDGADLIDFDGDGHDSDGYGGDDCNDADPTINPSRMDWLNDGVDNDCDSRDGARADLRLSRSTTVINGTEGVQEYMGQHVFNCDYDNDGLDDLVVAAPLGGGYKGRVGIWLADYADKWNEEMDMDDADVEIAGTSDTFFGMTAACGDLNGDGHDDLVIGAPEIHSRSYDQDYTLYVFYGTEDWTWAVTIARADAYFTKDFLPEDYGSSTLFADDIVLGDTNGDGKDEIIVEMPKSEPWMDRDEVWVIPGGTYEGEYLFDDLSSMTKLHLDDAQGDSGAGVDVAVIPDMNADGNQELVVMQPFYQVDPAPSEGDPTVEGRVWLLSNPETSGSFAESAFGNFLGGSDQYLGAAVLAADVDGSGKPDLLISAALETTQASQSGAIYVLLDPEGGLAGSRVIEDEATTVIDGVDEDGRVGADLFPVPFDIDADGKHEIMLRKELYDRSSSSPGDLRSEDELHLVAGGWITGDSVALEDIDLAWWQRENDAAFTGRTMTVGDVDGDGHPDFFFGAPRFLTYSTALRRDVTTGKVYLYGSRDNPWGYDVGVE